MTAPAPATTAVEDALDFGMEENRRLTREREEAEAAAAGEEAEAEVQPEPPRRIVKRRRRDGAYPEMFSIRLPRGTADRIHDAGERAGTWGNEWARKTLLAALARSERHVREKAKAAPGDPA